MEHRADQHQGLKVTGVDPDGIAAGFDLPAGSRLVMVNGKAMPDLFTFRMCEGAADLTLLFWHETEGLFEIDVEKDEDEPLGLDLEIVPGECFTHCHNRCVFCFIDQLPSGMRESLYFKDDDMRLSFLHGNYITMTNLSDAELDRLIELRFSPVNVSVHATEPALRRKMMRNRAAGDIMPSLKRLTEAGIDVNVQIVLCPGLNDGAHLERTFDDLAELNEFVRSIACVPVGLTRYRDENRLFALRSHTPDECRTLIDSVHRRQAAMLAARGERLFYLADEFYLKGNVSLPPAEAYESMSQLENGVGMAALFRDEFETDFPKAMPAANPFDDTVLVTGTLAGPVLKAYETRLSRRFNTRVTVAAIENRFFGETITVAGLLTGQDISDQLAALFAAWKTAGQKHILIPDNMLKRGTELFLDDLTVTDLRRALSAEVTVVSETASGLFEGLSKSKVMI